MSPMSQTIIQTQLTLSLFDFTVFTNWEFGFRCFILDRIFLRGRFVFVLVCVPLSSQRKLSCTHAKMHVYTCISACVQRMHVYTCKSHACVHMLFSMWGYPASTHALCTCKIACVHMHILHVYTCKFVVYT